MRACRVSPRPWRATFAQGVLCVSTLLGTAYAQTQAPTPPGTEAEFSALLAQTLRVHPQLRSKSSLTQSRRFESQAAEGQRYPTLSATLARTDQASARGTLSLRQPLWTFGRVDSNIALAAANEELARLDEWRAARQLLEQVAVAYAKAAGLHQQLVVSANSLQRLEELRQRIVRRRDGQQASTSDVRLIGSRLAQAQVQQDKLALEYESALEGLFTLSQMRVKAQVDLQPNLWNASADQGLDALALANSPDLAYQTQTAEVAKVQMKQVSRTAWPTVYARLDQPVGGTASNAALGVYLEASLDGAGSVVKANVLAAGARLQAAEEAVQLARDQLAGDLRVLKLQVAALARTQSQLDLALVDANLTYESYVRQFDAGFKSWSDVLNMQREVTDQQLAIVQNLTQRWTLDLRLSALMGRLEAIAGWKTERALAP